MRTVCYGNRRKRHEIATDLWSQTKYTINGNREISLEGRPYESHGDDQLIRSLEAYGDSRPSPCPCDTKFGTGKARKYKCIASPNTVRIHLKGFEPHRAEPGVETQ